MYVAQYKCGLDNRPHSRDVIARAGIAVITISRCHFELRWERQGGIMKILFKLGLLASTLMAASSAFALGGQSYGGLSVTDVQKVPEPAALGLLAVGVVVLALVRRKK
jgi:hypothetical protein